MKILIINGPNLDKLGEREPDVYGTLTLDQIKSHTQNLLKPHSIETEWIQSNLEGELVNAIQNGNKNYQAIIFNPAGYSYTSVAILDALKNCSVPKCEVHLSQIYQREEFRSQLLTAKGADMIMCGFGKDSYYVAALGLKEHK